MNMCVPTTPQSAIVPSPSPGASHFPQDTTVLKLGQLANPTMASQCFQVKRGVACLLL